MKKKKHGFTLAEVLITLSIIGVVAALTIPTLIQRTGNEEYVSRLMKTYSTLSQATEAIMTENGGVKTWASDVDNIYDLYKSHLRNAKECGSKAGCYTQGAYKFLNGGAMNNFENGDFRNLILSDGAQIMIMNLISKDCSMKRDGTENICVHIWTDINGAKTPNTVGRDLFQFVLKENGLYPAGCDSDVCSTSNSGWGCACKVIQEGAMNY